MWDNLGIRLRLTLPLLAAGGVLVAVIAWQSFDERARLRRAAAEVLLDKARLITARQQSLAEHAEALLDGMMRRPPLQAGPDTARCEQELREFIQTVVEFFQAGMASPDGLVLCSILPLPGRVSLADRNWFIEAQLRHHMVVSDVIRGRVSGKPTVIFAKARRDAAGRVAAVYFLALDLDWLQGQLGLSTLPAGTRLVVLDRRNVVAARYPDPEGWAGRSVEGLPVVRQLRSRDEGMIEAVGLDGMERLFGHTPFLKTESGDLQLFLTVPKTVVEASADRNFQTNVAVMLGALAAMLLLLVSSGQHLLVRPLTLLARQAERLGAGDLTAKSGLPHGRDEIGQLARTLDEASTALHESESSYEALFRNLRNGLAVSKMLYVDGKPDDFVYLRVNRSFEDITGLKDIVGKRGSELIPDIRTTNPELFAIYGRVAAGGAAESFETHVEALDMWFAVSVYSPRQDHFIAIFDDITERKRAGAEILAARNMLQTVVDTVPLGVFWKDRESHFLGCNLAFARLASCHTPEELVGHDDFDLPWCGHATSYQADDVEVMATGSRHDIIESLGLDDGTPSRWLETIKVPLHDADGRVTGVLGVFQDITEKKNAADLLAAREREFCSLAENVPDNVARFDCEARGLYLNPALECTLGVAPGELLGRTPNETHPDGRFEDLERAIRQVAAEGGSLTLDQTTPGGDGQTRYHSIRLVAETDAEGRIVSILTIGRDLTEMRRKDEHIRHLAYHDTLTGLPNRTLFQDRLEHAVERARRRGERFSVNFLDLDGFKGINDTLGHDAGDQLLKVIAKRIHSHMRRATDTVARLGGDEFVVLMEDPCEAKQCVFLAKEIIAAVSQPLELCGRTVSVGVSMGMAFYPKDGVDPRELMKHADIAMYAAKQAGKGTYRFFDVEMLEQTVAMSSDFRRRGGAEAGGPIIHP